MTKREGKDSFEERLASSSMDLFWEWWVASTQALVDNIGSEEALKALRPYYLNANSAASQICGDYFKEMAKDPDFVSMMGIFSSEAWFGCQSQMRASDRLWVLDNHGCKTNGECKELCHLTCKELMDNQAQRVNPEAFAVLEKSLCRGDDHCRILIGAKEGMAEYSCEGMRTIKHPEVSEWEFRSFQVQYLSESWVFTTRALIDQLGARSAADNLRSYMRHSGLSYGIALTNHLRGGEKGIELLGRIIGALNDGHMRKGSRRATTDMVDEEVRECPFSQAPPETCLQYEAFFNGICEAIDPSYEFSYDRMMTDGDEICHWAIRRKRTVPGSPSRKDPDEELLRRLKSRLVEGEITPEQYRQLLELLMENK
ncbi:MAG: hypothetical protein LUQ39_06815 [Methanomassiliicoccales archaeon]|nr:hypothetical protein [Methanomassiliicoccales archaeon]